jgi:serine-type D-Ala-D-Ala carboxypeptidase (penicillin-binding protein 5/6)
MRTQTYRYGVVTILSLCFVTGVAFLYYTNVSAQAGQAIAVIPSTTPTTTQVVARTAQTQQTSKIIIGAQAGFLAKVDMQNNTLDVLYEKNATQILPIASISKLITAYSIIQTRKLTDTFKVTWQAVNGPWPSRKFTVGDTYTLRELLEAMLVESNNDAARVVAAATGERKFVGTMNTAAAGLSLLQTTFYTSDGTDQQIASSTKINVSSAEDVARLIVQLYQKAPGILQVTTLPRVEVSDVTGTKVFTAYSTNKLLSMFTDGFTLLGGKTGTTNADVRHLVLLFKDMKGDMYVAVILDAQDNFKDMETLLQTLI